MRKFILIFVMLLSVTACGGGEEPAAQSEAGTIAINDIYSFIVPSGAPVGAVFMTITNQSNEDDRMIGFKSDHASRIELHTMAMDGEIMRMRQVNGFTIPAGQDHSLRPGGDHIMLYGVQSALAVGQTFNAIAVFEKAGEIPLTVEMRNRP